MIICAVLTVVCFGDMLLQDNDKNVFTKKKKPPQTKKNKSETLVQLGTFGWFKDFYLKTRLFPHSWASVCSAGTRVTSRSFIWGVTCFCTTKRGFETSCRNTCALKDLYCVERLLRAQQLYRFLAGRRENPAGLRPWGLGDNAADLDFCISPSKSLYVIILCSCGVFFDRAHKPPLHVVFRVQFFWFCGLEMSDGVVVWVFQKTEGRRHLAVVCVWPNRLPPTVCGAPFRPLREERREDCS